MIVTLASLDDAEFSLFHASHAAGKAASEYNFLVKSGVVDLHQQAQVIQAAEHLNETSSKMMANIRVMVPGRLMWLRTPQTRNPPTGLGTSTISRPK